MSRPHLEAVAHRSLTAEVDEVLEDLVNAAIPSAHNQSLRQQLAAIASEISTLHSQERLLPAWRNLDDRINLIDDHIRNLSHQQHI